MVNPGEVRAREWASAAGSPLSRKERAGGPDPLCPGTCLPLTPLREKARADTQGEGQGRERD